MLVKKIVVGESPPSWKPEYDVNIAWRLLEHDHSFVALVTMEVWNKGVVEEERIFDMIENLLEESIQVPNRQHYRESMLLQTDVINYISYLLMDYMTDLEDFKVFCVGVFGKIPAIEVLYKEDVDFVVLVIEGV